MMRGAILTIFIAFSSSVVLAQTGIDHEKLSKELDRFELELLYYYIKDNYELTRKDKPETYLKQVNDGLKLLESVKINNWSTADLSSVRVKLQNEYNWSKTTENVIKWLEPIRNESKGIEDLESLKAILGRHIHQAGVKDPTFKKLYDHINKHNPGKLDELIGEILNQVQVEVIDAKSDSDNDNNQDEQNAGKQKNEPNANTESMAKKNGQPMEESAGFSYLVSGVMAFATFVLGLVVGWFVIRGGGGKKTGSRSRKSRGDSKEINEETWNQATQVVNKHNSETKKLNEQILRLTKENKELKDQNEAMMTKKVSLEVESVPQSVETIEPQAQPKVVYLSSPSDDGSFSRTYETATIGNKSYFEFILTSENTADFKFIDDASIQKKAIDTFGARIKEIADELNWIEAQSKGINMEALGKAEKDGETWKVSKKAKVRYI